MSIADKITRLQTAKTNIANAITTKGGTVSAGDGFEDFATDIATIPSGSGGVEEKDINFYDYDGFRVESWTLAELQGKTALPNQPDHSTDIQYAGETIPLTVDGWNWTLADLQSVNKSGINVGATYKTTSGEHITCHCISVSNSARSITLYPNGTATIDWGDGSAVDTVTGTSVSTAVTTSHTYENVGRYIIKIAKVSGTVRISNLLDALNKIEYVYYSTNLVYNTNAFGVSNISSNSLKYMAIPKTVNLGTTGISYAANCNSLKTLIIPKSGGYNMCGVTYGLDMVSIPKLNGALWGFGTSCIRNFPYFAGATKLQGFTLCYCLEKLVVPSTVTTITSDFLKNAYSMKELKFESITPPTIGGASFQTMNPACKILVPTGTLSAYTSATNYPSPSTYTYEEY